MPDLTPQQMWDEEARAREAGEPTPAAEPPAEPPVQTEEPTTDTSAAAEPEPEAPAPEAEDPLAGVPEGVRKQLARIDELAAANAQLTQHVRSAEGRVAAMQRELQVAKAAQQTVAPKDAPTQTQVAAAAKSLKKWDALKTEFPEWADGVEELVAANRADPQPQAPVFTPEQVAELVRKEVAAVEGKTARMVESLRVETKHGNWQDTVNSTEFTQWFLVQNPETRALADSPNAADAIRMLDLFQEAKKRPAAEIRNERGARLAAAATTRPGTTPPPKNESEMSAEEIWNQEAARREKTRAARGF
mgnify:CR=1 FL=1